MKSIIVIVALLFIVAISVNAQKGNNQIGIAAQMGLPTGHFESNFKTGYGGSLKGLWGIGKTGQLTFTTGYTSFKSKGDLYHNFGASSIIPFLAGYRLQKNNFYVEPQVGYGLYILKIKVFGQKMSESDGAFTYAIGIGYAKNGFDLGVRYQGANKGSNDITIVGIRLGYNISFKK